MCLDNIENEKKETDEVQKEAEIVNSVKEKKPSKIKRLWGFIKRMISKSWTFMKNASWKKRFITIILLVILSVAGYYGTFRLIMLPFTRTVEFQVTGKEHKVYNGIDTNLVETNKGVYKLVPDWSRFRSKTYDDYALITVNDSYTCVIVGIRLGINSSFPNIVSCKDANGEKLF